MNTHVPVGCEDAADPDLNGFEPGEDVDGGRQGENLRTSPPRTSEASRVDVGKLPAGNAPVPYDELTAVHECRSGGFAGRGLVAQHSGELRPVRSICRPLACCLVVGSGVEVELRSGPEGEVAAGGDRQGQAGG